MMPAPQTCIKDVLKDPSATYDSPQQVVDDTALSLGDKREILRCWEEDVKALMRAEAENMPPPGKIPTTGDQLALIVKLREELE